MREYTSITIIYNPNSTGSSEKLARRFAARLRKRLPKREIDVTPTEYAGHAEKMAEDLAMASSRALVISSSGDGGYHEVVNGLMKAVAHGAKPTAGLLPAGNANDHYHNVHLGDTVEAIATGKTQAIDLLRLTAVYDGKPIKRYAHSYIGVGLTPKVGQELNKTKLNRFNEVLIVARVILGLRPILLEIDGKTQAYDSIICSNVQKMSKVLTIATEAKVDDGKFEVTIFQRRNKLKLIRYLLRASTRGLAGAIQTKRFAFLTPQPAILQLDGEITNIDSKTEAVVELVPSKLQCVV